MPYLVIILHVYFFFRSSRTAQLKQLEMLYTSDDTLKGKGGGGGGGGGIGSGARKSIAMHRSMLNVKANQSQTSIRSSSDASLIPRQSLLIPYQSLLISGDNSTDMYVTCESCLSHEVGLILLNVLEIFGDCFKVI